MASNTKIWLQYIGQKFSKLTVLDVSLLKSHPHATRRHSYFYCRCECGVEKNIMAYSVKNLIVKSCGCLRDTKTKKLHYKHGYTAAKNEDRPMYATKIYNTWYRIRQTCILTNSGIYDPESKMEESWEDFLNFAKDIPPPPGKNYSFTRIDSSKHFTKDNCHWVPVRELYAKRSDRRLMTHEGRTMDLHGWSKETGLKYGALYGRWMRSNFSQDPKVIGRILKTPKVLENLRGKVLVNSNICT